MENEDRKRRQMKLANLFYEMGMDLNLVEKMSGVSKQDILNNHLLNSCNVPVSFDASGNKSIGKF